MFFTPKAKKQLEKILVDKYKYHTNKPSSILRKEDENNKYEICFYRWFSTLRVNLHYDMDESYHDFVCDTFDKWAHSLDDRLEFVVLYDNGVEFELKEDINNVNADYIIYLMDKITDKFNEIIYTIE